MNAASAIRSFDMGGRPALLAAQYPAIDVFTFVIDRRRRGDVVGRSHQCVRNDDSVDAAAYIHDRPDLNTE